jgi:sugar phosphate isomerase/epimerase
MHFGVCANPADSSWIKEAGADFIEALVQPFLRPADAHWQPPVPRDQLAVPLVAYNTLFPADLRITGPGVDPMRIKGYVARACRRAHEMHSSIIVFGSGPARKYPDDWPRAKAEEQLIDAMRIIGPLAKSFGIVVVMEPLNRGESNILNSVAEGLSLLRRAKAPGLKVLCDYYHLALEHEPLENLDDTRGLLAHVHIAEPEGRTPPRPGLTDFRPFFAKLKQIGYDARIAVECNWQDMKTQLAPTLEYLRQEWAAA